jgi:hypothetical protein
MMMMMMMMMMIKGCSVDGRIHGRVLCGNHRYRLDLSDFSFEF